MNKNWSGLFSLGLQSVEWQLKNLFQDVGGEKVVELMDLLAGVPESQREMLIESFIKQTSKHVSASTELNIALNAEEKALKKIEDQIVSEVVAGMKENRKLSIVQGGKYSLNTSAKLFDFESAKKIRLKTASLKSENLVRFESN